MPPNRARYVWDYDITQEEFDALLKGTFKKGHLDRDWAAVRVIEWAPYKEMVRILGFPALQCKSLELGRIEKLSFWQTNLLW